MSDPVERQFGVVDRLKPTYGFLKGDDGLQIFLAATATPPRGLFDGLVPGDRVSYLAVSEPRGVRALLVERM